MCRLLMKRRETERYPVQYLASINNDDTVYDSDVVRGVLPSRNERSYALKL